MNIKYLSLLLISAFFQLAQGTPLDQQPLNLDNFQQLVARKLSNNPQERNIILMIHHQTTNGVDPAMNDYLWSKGLHRFLSLYPQFNRHGIDQNTLLSIFKATVLSEQ